MNSIPRKRLPSSATNSVPAQDSDAVSALEDDRVSLPAAEEYTSIPVSERDYDSVSPVEHYHHSLPAAGQHYTQVPASSERIYGSNSTLEKRPVRQLSGLSSIGLSFVAITIPTVLFAVVLLFLVFHYQVHQSTDPEAYYINFSSSRLAFVSSMSSTVAAWLATPFMILYSYRIARNILRSSIDEDVTRLPSPYQTNLIIGLISGGVGPLFSWIKYELSRKPKAPQVPGLFRSGFVLLAILGLRLAAPFSFQF